MSAHVRPDTNPTPHQRPWTPEKRGEMADCISRLWDDPAFRAAMCAKMREGHLRKHLTKMRTA